MLTFDATTKTELIAAINLTDWANILNNALTSNKRVKCLRNAVEFRNVAAIGSFTVANNALNLACHLNGTITSLAADMSTGTSVLRVESSDGVRWVQGTLGNSGTDFTVSGNFTTNNGIVFQSSAKIIGFANLPPALNTGNMVVRFGVSGSPSDISIAEIVYSGMSVGHGSVTQTRWRSDPIVVNGISFVIFPGMDSDGRYDFWINAAWKLAVSTTDKAQNRERADVSIQVLINNVPQDLFGAGTTYNYTHQRTTWLRWQSVCLNWDTSNAFILNKIAAGSFLKHDSRNVFGSLENQSDTTMSIVTGYQPFKTFSDISQTTKIGDQNRSTPAGGERTTIGPCHEWYARLISELGTNNNSSWLTANKLKVLQDLADTAGQYPIASGLLSPVDYHLLDPSLGYCTHDNANAWAPNLGIPQPGTTGSDTGNSTELPFDSRYDAAHPYNKISFHAHHFSKDPYHLMLVQGQAIAAIAFGSGYQSQRGTDGKTLRCVVQEERGFWWCMQTLIHAWSITPSGTMPKPFRDKAYFATAIDNTLQYIRDGWIGTTTPYYAGLIEDKVCKYWRIVSPFTLSNEVSMSPFMCDYGHIVMCEALLLGYTGARDVAEWHAVNAERRAACAGNWYFADPYVSDTAGSLRQATALAADTTLSYTDTATYKSWYPRQNDYTTGDLTLYDWRVDYGRDTYMWIAVLNLYKEVSNRGLITLGFNAATEEASARLRHKPPYVSIATGNPSNYTIWCKQYFSY